MRSERCDSALTDSPGCTTGRGRGQVGQPNGREWPTGRVQWMNESLAKGANGQQSCWHTDHTQPQPHTQLHFATHTHTHTWDANKSAAFAVSRSSAWLGFALMLCCILYGVLGTLRVCQLPVASNRFVCIPFCLSVPSSFILPPAVHVSHTAVFQFAQKTHSHVDCRLVHFDVIVRLISSLSSVWQSNCQSVSLPPPLPLACCIFLHFHHLVRCICGTNSWQLSPPTGWGFD